MLLRRQHPAPLSHLALLLAAAGVAGVEDPTARSGEPLSERSAGNPQERAGLITTQLKDGPQDKGHAVLAAQAQQHCVGAGQSNLVPQDLIDLNRAELQRGRHAALDVGAEALEVSPQPLRGALVSVQQMVGRDAVGPGHKAALPAEAPQVGDHADQDLLGGLLGVPG